jgi:hypothetical protein
VDIPWAPVEAVPAGRLRPPAQEVVAASPVLRWVEVPVVVVAAPALQRAAVAALPALHWGAAPVPVVAAAPALQRVAVAALPDLHGGAAPVPVAEAAPALQPAAVAAIRGHAPGAAAPASLALWQPQVESSAWRRAGARLVAARPASRRAAAAAEASSALRRVAAVPPASRRAPVLPWGKAQPGPWRSGTPQAFPARWRVTRAAPASPPATAMAAFPACRGLRAAVRPVLSPPQVVLILAGSQPVLARVAFPVSHRLRAGTPLECPAGARPRAQPARPECRSPAARAVPAFPAAAAFVAVPAVASPLAPGRHSMCPILAASDSAA